MGGWYHLVALGILTRKCPEPQIVRLHRVLRNIYYGA
tara:strand:- start:2932 stop:3042 length:111 start_codon:yes stop_codon:yes gene_type:complete